METKEKNSAQGKKRVTDDEIAEALRLNGGTQLVAAQWLKKKGQIIDRTTISRRMRKNPKLIEAAVEGMDVMGDAAENTVFKHIRESNLTAAIFYLKTKMKHRGYVEKAETAVSNKNNEPLKIEVSKNDDAEFENKTWEELMVMYDEAFEGRKES